MALSPREELLRIQKSLFKRNQRLIQESTLIKEPDFDRYEKRYKRFVRNYRQIVTIPKMMAACLDADILYVGDYHTCNQSQKSFLKIVKAIHQKGKKAIIALELLHQQHQKTVDRFLQGKIGESTFLKKIGIRRRWVFDLWENFKPIFDFARQNNIPIIGIDAAPQNARLKIRDQATAMAVAKAASLYPDRKITVLVGDLHIAPPHLPNEVRKELKRFRIKKKVLILYQNSEAIYWKLAAQGKEQYTEAVRVSDNGFCRMNTPPVILQRSYLNWLENEEGELDYSDARHEFMELVDHIARFLSLRIGRGAKDQVEVYTSGDLSFLEKVKKQKRFGPEELQIIKHQIISDESYYIPKFKIVYLGNLSLNHAGEEAAHFIKHICSGEEKPRDPFDAFYANILHEALGFFGSKIVNHKRKCYHEKDYQKLIQYFRRVSNRKKKNLEFETALLTYQTKRLECQGEAMSDMELFQGRRDLFFAVTHALGYILGDKLYYALMENKMTKSEIRSLFYDPWEGFGKPFQTYWMLTTATREVPIPKSL